MNDPLWVARDEHVRHGRRDVKIRVPIRWVPQQHRVRLVDAIADAWMRRRWKGDASASATLAGPDAHLLLEVWRPDGDAPDPDQTEGN